MTATIDIASLGQCLDDVLVLLAGGTEVVLADRDRPIARVRPMGSAPAARLPRLHRGSMVMRDDFDTPLPDAFWSGEPNTWLLRRR